MYREITILFGYDTKTKVVINNSFEKLSIFIKYNLFKVKVIYNDGK